ncbi:MAG: hypothetical protein LBF37_00380 [Rickettsiales bacterium]|nr:hypothetical protein [Rickettsiales bacterium]
MAIYHYTEDAFLIMGPGTYKVIAIGPGGNGGKGGTSNSNNNNTTQAVYGAMGGGGGAGGYVFEEIVEAPAMFAMSISITTIETKLQGAVTLALNKDSVLSGSAAGGIDASVPVPGASVGASNPYVGSRGGGAGGTRGSRATSSTPTPTTGGLGDYGNGATSVIGELTGNYDQRAGGAGAAGAGNTVVATGAGEGGLGAEDNGLVVSANTTAADVAQMVSAGNGGSGSQPASRPAQAGIPGGDGGGGGGSWTSGANGEAPTTSSVGVNGQGGDGGAGGKGCVWVIEISQQKTR